MASFKIETERTICFLVNQDRILLGMKKKGQGAGNYNGFGGKVEAGESYEDAAVREVFEESGLIVDKRALEKRAVIEFHFPYKSEWNQRVHVYFANSWQGGPRETEEMKPEWFNKSAVPYERMWESDLHWLPLLLEGRKINAFFRWKEDNKSVDGYSIREAVDF